MRLTFLGICHRPPPLLLGCGVAAVFLVLSLLPPLVSSPDSTHSRHSKLTTYATYILNTKYKPPIVTFHFHDTTDLETFGTLFQTIFNYELK